MFGDVFVTFLCCCLGVEGLPDEVEPAKLRRDQEDPRESGQSLAARHCPVQQVSGISWLGSWACSDVVLGPVDEQSEVFRSFAGDFSNK